MKGKPPVFLVDTNVWLDNYLGFRPNHRTSCEFLDEALAQGAALCHAATTAKDVHFFTCSFLKKAAHERGEEIDEGLALAISKLAWANLANMNEVSTLVGVDLSDFWLASKLSAFREGRLRRHPRQGASQKIDRLRARTRGRHRPFARAALRDARPRRCRRA